ncbi:RagB/SusD family nutrient uptake outer membrane protein [Ravibacter arvi]|uniref:RagB/SusD family nutrient uptake outer membrane protein n=1 Tax=Ravibacter arvi TaxID=2051041 RepID=A0ABP8LUV4_9BACT
MKKISISALLTSILWISTSCSDYLDKVPKSDLNEAAVFTQYENVRSFFDVVYTANGVFKASILGTSSFGSLHLDNMCDFADGGRVMWNSYHKWGPLGDNVGPHFYNGILVPFFKYIRISNMVLKNVSRIQDARSEDDLNDLIGQAHFIRAFCHFELFRYWGAMPYIVKVIGGDDAWDIPRLSKNATLRSVAADMDTAFTYLEKAKKIRRDGRPGESGHLNHPDQERPNGVTAKAMKARALLYAASPLNNENGQKDWQDAAVANWEAIKIAKEYGYELLTADRYTENYVGAKYSNEQLWANHYGAIARTNGLNKQLTNAVFTNSPTNDSGLCPSQGAVDMFETRWGDPLNTEADRAAATALGHYKEQDPFVNRDPRFYLNIIYNGAPIPGYGTAKIYTENINGVSQGSELIPNSGYQGITRTGYYMRKYWGGQSIKNPISPLYTSPMIRLGELYLNYAEAANEAYGPNAPAPGAEMSAVDVINMMRARWSSGELAPVQSRFTTGAEVFRPRVKNERNVELAFEGHYYHDIRRWKDAPITMSATQMGIIPEKVAVSAEYPTGFKYVRRPLSDDRQSRWFDAKYYLPFMSTDYFKFKAFEPGQVW